MPRSFSISFASIFAETALINVISQEDYSIFAEKYQFENNGPHLARIGDDPCGYRKMQWKKDKTA